MPDARIFSAVIQAAGNGGAYVTVPFDVESVFGAKRVPIQARIDGEPYRGTLVRMGGPDHILLVRKDIREKIGKQLGDTVDVVLEKDMSERIVELPPDLVSALDDEPQMRAFFDGLSFTHRKEYVNWITEAKRTETRQARIAKTLALLKNGHRTR
jgi:hypothetical protein